MMNASALSGVGFWKGAGIPAGERSHVFVECGCCGHYHRADFYGDCREDAERYPSRAAGELPEDAEIVTLEDQIQEGM